MINKVASPKELRKFGLTLAIMIFLFAVLIPYLRHGIFFIWPFIFIAPLALLALVAPLTLTVVQKLWIQLGHILGAINTRIILGAFYFLILVPMAMLARMRGVDKLGLKLDLKATTYRKLRVVAEDLNSHMENIF